MRAGSYARDASSARNKTQESILEPNLFLAHESHELLFIFVCKKINAHVPHKRQIIVLCLQMVSVDDMEGA